MTRNWVATCTHFYYIRLEVAVCGRFLSPLLNGASGGAGRALLPALTSPPQLP